MRTPVVIALALVFLASFSVARAQDETGGVDFARLRELFKGGERSFLDGKFEDSVKSFSEFLELLPKTELMNEPRSHAHYYVACAYAKLVEKGEGAAAKENTDKAVSNVEKAMEFGFREFSIIDKDPDLDAIRKSEKFIALVGKYKRLEEEKLQGFDFDVVSVDGKKLAKKDFLGKVLIVDVWGTWCPPCRQEIPHFVELQKKYGEKGLQIVGLNSERTTDKAAAEKMVRDFMKTFEMNYPCAIASEDDLAKVPDLRGFPTTLFIDRKGRVRHKVVGYHDLEKLEGLIAPLLAEKVAKKEEAKEGEEKKDGEG